MFTSAYPLPTATPGSMRTIFRDFRFLTVKKLFSAGIRRGRHLFSLLHHLSIMGFRAHELMTFVNVSVSTLIYTIEPFHSQMFVAHYS